MQIARISSFATPDVGTVTPSGAPGLIRRMIQAWRLKQQVYREMGPMSDRDLADLGISRLDVDRIANGDDVRRDG
jgi:uncharacterized protein YjiS (DUF1127 family)